MSAENPRVVWMPAGLDACAAFRMFFPHINMPESQFLFKWGQIDFKEFEGNEVAVVQRQVGERNLAALKSLRANGYKIVYDLDDNVWALVAANPLARVFKQMEEAWFPCAEQANVITVSTRGLASAVKSHLGHLKKEIIVCPNGIPFDIYRQATTSRDDGMVVIGWQGSNTHGDDIKEAWDTLPGILNEHENVRMEFLGHPPPKELWSHPRIKVRGWSPVGEFPARLASWAWDIALAPLEDTRFNRSKSAIKAMESASMKVPCLCSDVQPYNEWASLGGADLKWLLCNTQTQWRSKLKVLINEPERRVALGELAYKVTERFFNVKILVENWKRACQLAMQC